MKIYHLLRVKSIESTLMFCFLRKKMHQVEMTHTRISKFILRCQAQLDYSWVPGTVKKMDFCILLQAQLERILGVRVFGTRKFLKDMVDFLII